jgi:hypothetical protein
MNQFGKVARKKNICLKVKRKKKREIRTLDYQWNVKKMTEKSLESKKRKDFTNQECF